jgi:hypothetical protein
VPNALLVGTGVVAVTSTATTWYTISGAVSDNWTPETPAQCTYRTAGTFSNLWYNIITNGKAQTLVTILRKNLASVNQTITVGSTATGTFVDSTHTDAIVAGDKLDLQFPFTAAGTFTLAVRSMIFAATTNTVTRTGKDNFTTFNTASQTSFIRVIGDNHAANTTNESDSKIPIYKVGTFQNCEVNINTNTNTNTATLRSRVNNVNANIVVSISSGTTGVLEDTTHSDSLNFQYFNYSFVTGASTVNIEVDEIYTDYISTNGDSIHSAGADGTLAQNSSTTQYYGLSDGMITITTESQTQSLSNGIFTLSYFFTNLDGNSTTGGTSVGKLRANGSNTALTASMNPGTTGFASDSTHTYSAASTDLLNYQYVTGTGASTSVNLAAIAVFMNSVRVVPIGMTETTTISDSKVRKVIPLIVKRVVLA